MNLNPIYESDIEEASLNWLADLGYTVLHGTDTISKSLYRINRNAHPDPVGAVS